VAKLGDSDKVKQGELAVAIGNPLGHELAGTVTVGVISAVDRTIQVDGREFKLLQTDAAISPGNSGGALVNANGEVIGMNTMKLSSGASEGLGFAIPSNVFVPIAQELIKNGKIERPGLGVTVSEVTEEMSKDYGYPAGVIIVQIMSDGAADKAGLLPRDVIIAIEGEQITTLDQLKEKINQYKVGDVIKLRVWRSGKEFDLPIKLQQLE
jgi:serine protease Do